MKTTPLREKFIEVLTLKGYSARTIETYVSVVAGLARHYHRSPDRLSAQEVRAYLYHLHQELFASLAAGGVTGRTWRAVGMLHRPSFTTPEFQAIAGPPLTGYLSSTAFSIWKMILISAVEGALTH